MPVTIADVTAAGTLYCVPYIGNVISLYSGGLWVPFISSEFNLSLTLTSGQPYDIFCYDSSGTPTLEVLVWTNDTTRATALVYQDGILCKSGDTTRRYLGSLYASGTDTTEDSLVKRYLWNYYNRITRSMVVIESGTANWDYTTDTYRQANADTANQLDFIVGVSEDIIHAMVHTFMSNSDAGAVIMSVGIGLDSTTTDSSQIRTPQVSIGGSGITSCLAIYSNTIAVGRHYLPWLERSVATGTATWYGARNNAQSGISGTIRC